MLTNLQYRILKRIAPVPPPSSEVWGDGTGSKLTVLLGSGFFPAIAGKIVIDFGCGEGEDAIQMARKGAKRVIGIDIREEILGTARRKAAAAGLASVCLFASSATEAADMVVSVDAFEHFANPAEILRMMSELLRPGGEVRVSFGPTWYHPLGGHLFSFFPWSHLLFSEAALIQWRAQFRADGARRFSEVEGGLNQMTIGRFEGLVANSPLKFAGFELVPIQKLRRFHNRLTREFTTAVVRGRLVKRS